MIRLENFRFSKMGKTKFPEVQDAYIRSVLLPLFVTGQVTKAVNRTLLDCVKLFNQNHTLDCPPKDVEKRLYECNNSLKMCLYNLVAKLKRQAPGSLPQQMCQRQTVLKLKGTHRLTPMELYFWKICMEPSFVHAFEAEKEQVQAMPTSDESTVTENGGRDSRHPKNKKQQESGRDLQVGWKLAKEWLASAPEEVRQEIEALALEDAEHKKRMFQEGTPESVQRALQKIELMGSEIMKVIKEAGWVCYIHAGGLVPGEFYPRMLCLNIGKNKDGLMWGQHHPNYQEHMADSFAQFLCSTYPYPLILADEICQRYQDKMASIHHSNDSDEATIAAGLEEGFQSMAWDAGAGKRKTTSVTVNTTATDAASNGDGFNTASPSIHDSPPPVPEFMMTNSAAPGAASIGDNLDAVLATVCSVPPVEAEVADQTTIITHAPAYHTPLAINMVNACPLPLPNNHLPNNQLVPTSLLDHLWGMDMFMPMYDSGCGGNDVPSEIWDLPSLNFNSVDPSYLQLNLSHVGSSDLGFQPPLDVQQAGIDAALQWDAGQSMLDPVSKEEMPYLLSTWRPVIPEVVPKILVQMIAEAPAGSDDASILRQTTELSRKPTLVEGQDGLEEACQGEKENTVRSSRGQVPVSLDVGSEVDEAETVLRSIDLGKDYLALVDGRFPVLGRPSALSDLLKKKPWTAALPVLSKEGQKTLIDETLHWWNSLQPASRHSSIPGELPSGDFPEDMGKLKKKAFTADVQVSFGAMLSAGAKRKMGTGAEERTQHCCAK
ncbi:hypothetical protein EDD18DRAFT_1115251 [Armillaria luteobubalina]|uniref:Uncharacterized protein n=1 Tax=Armillaria luteobubalina TaxID=153913 RepID=A0AA39P3M0_9AGAR|nr:hypothetical protein EDD18DRAFT_1115251 [Armillaria luteobubalina]